MRKIIVLFILSIYSNIFSQQEGLFTQYMFNPSILNPAYTVSNANPMLFLQQRTQWGDLEGAPQTNFLNFNHPSLFNNLGLGVSIVNDNLGPVNDFSSSFDLSTLVRINDNWNTSLGLKFSYNVLNVNFDILNIYNPNDPYFLNSIEDQGSFNLGFGVFLYSEESYVGFSSPFVFKNSHFDSESVLYKATDEQHFYLTAGHVFQLKNDIKLKPSIITRYVSNLPLQLDFSVNAFFFEKFILGTSHRINSAFSFLAGFYASKNLMIGYSHDAETNRLKDFAGNSSEFFLKWEITPKEIINPRFF